MIFGTNNYIEYQVGTLPLVISVSHGGELEPVSIPDRTCNNPVYAVDAFTIETAMEIKNHLFNLTGCYPHIIISHLKRNKLDPNRSLADGACGNAEAITAWNEFHNFIDDARNTANQQYNDQTFFVDLHGHGNPIQRIELGYLLYDDELELPDSVLNTQQYINYSSIKNLAQNNINNFTHAELLRGSNSLGTLLMNDNYPAVPSQDIPAPGTNTNYFSGGYITANHTSFNPAAPINGLQMELNYTNIRDTPSNRTAFADTFSEVIVDFLNTHFNVNWNSCNPLSTLDQPANKEIIIYPNPVEKGNSIHFVYSDDNKYRYQIYDITGQLIKKGIVDKNQIETDHLNSGTYFIKLSNKDEQKTDIKTILVK